jgi:protein phosphatase
MTAYAILSGELDGTDGAPFLLDFVRLPYDIEKAATLAQEARMPESRSYVGELRTAIHRSRLPRSDRE